jgi:copper chaperone NosL
MRRLLALVATAMLVAACGSEDTSGPPDIQYGRDICVQCNMIISEAKFATAYRTVDGAEKIFDDIGGMVIHLRTTGDELSAGEAWVHDFNTEEWIGAEEAFYVPTTSVSSPMGHSILAFASEAAAGSFAHDVGAEVIDFATVMTLETTGMLLGTHHEGEAMDHGSSVADDDAGGGGTGSN